MTAVRLDFVNVNEFYVGVAVLYGVEFFLNPPVLFGCATEPHVIVDVIRIYFIQDDGNYPVNGLYPVVGRGVFEEQVTYQRD